MRVQEGEAECMNKYTVPGLSTLIFSEQKHAKKHSVIAVLKKIGQCLRRDQPAADIVTRSPKILRYEELPNLTFRKRDWAIAETWAHLELSGRFDEGERCR